MTYEEFDASFGGKAEAESRDLASLPVSILLLRVEAGDLGTHYQIWPAIARRATLEQAGGILYRFVRSDADYLNRYHCAEALLTLLGFDDLEAADLTVEHRHPERALERVRAELQSRLGVAFE